MQDTTRHDNTTQYTTIKDKTTQDKPRQTNLRHDNIIQYKAIRDSAL